MEQVQKIPNTPHGKAHLVPYFSFWTKTTERDPSFMARTVLARIEKIQGPTMEMDPSAS